MTAAPAAFPWDEAMAAGFGLLRLSPQTFWAMTPREFAAALAAFGAGQRTVPDRADLSALMARYPDKEKGV